MKTLSPKEVMVQVAAAIPDEHRMTVIVIGSLAAGYHFFKDDGEREVRTKDIDCLLAPRDEAKVSGEAVATALLANEWTHRREGDWAQAQESPTPVEKLSVIRLYPPNSKDWFAELLTVPESENERGKGWLAVELDDGFYGLCSFEFLSLAAYKPSITSFGLQYARPEMMALANLLSHPDIKPEPMSSKYEGRTIKRSNKDLGRVLALAILSGDHGVADWAAKWAEALQACFPTRYRALAKTVGSGFRELLESDNDLEEALHTCNIGLLAGEKLRLDQYRSLGARFVQDAIESLEEALNH